MAPPASTSTRTAAAPHSRFPPPMVVRVCVLLKRGEFVVEPAITFLRPDDELRIFNTTGEEIQILPGSRDPFSWAKLRGRRLRTARRFTWRVPKAAHRKAPQVLRYRIQMVKSGTWARGNSDPVIIIDNP